MSVASNSTNVAQLYEAFKLLSLSGKGFKGEVLFSGAKGGKEVLDAAAAAYTKATSSKKTIVNVFDDLEAGQEFGIYRAPSGEAVKPVVYQGPTEPHSVVLLPSSQHAALAAAALAAMESPATSKVGVATVNALTSDTFDADLASVIPTSVQTIYAPTANTEVDEAATWFYEVALTSATASSKLSATVFPLPLISSWTIHEWAATLVRIASPSSSKAFATPKIKSLLPASNKLTTFWSSDVGASAGIAASVAGAFAKIAHASEGGVAPRLLETFDNTAGGKSSQGLGVKSADLLLAPVNAPDATEAPLSALSLTSEPSFIFVSAPQFVLNSYNAIERAGPATQIVFSGPWAAEEYKEKLGKHEKAKLAGHSNVWTVNAESVAKEAGFAGEQGTSLVEQITFWQMYLGNGQPSQIGSLVTTSLPREAVGKLIAATKGAVHKVDLSASDMEVDEDEKVLSDNKLAPGEADATVISHPSFIPATKASYGPNAFKEVPEILPVASNWHIAAKQLLYPEAYALPKNEKETMRPDLPEENYIVTVTENRRLTPLDYDRNVFHIEFSTAGTGLKYAIGEALGVHGLNDEKEVLEFIDWYGLDPDALVSYPSRTDPTGKLETRTIFQLFQQTLDIFGKPPKSFYEVLGKYATSREEARHLRFISSAEGSSTFKKWSELETVTYADVLKAFPSAKANFGIEELMREVAAIKPRHYSIASSQNAVGDSVHLLVVTVDWDTPSGAKRYGQCTRYLAGLPVGAKVMVSVKPSVMKLPPRDTQPIIMAGLGTGAAPFRAFMQERAWQKAQGIEVGPLLYYFGARYRSAEYLYGEEIEAYVRDGVISHTGLAFSRDTKAKVYIQHKMNEDQKLLADSLEDGVFYLCGPTWPVPDVYQALTDAFVGKGKTVEEAQAHIEELKEDERYVLEVY